MLARKRLQRVGNSTGLVLTSELLRAAKLARGGDVIVHAEDGWNSGPSEGV